MILSKSLFFYLALLGIFGFGQNSKPAEISNVNIIEDKVGKKIDLDRTFIDKNGEEVNLINFVQEKSVLVINFFYFTCPMICGVALDGLSKALSGLEKPMNSNYQVFSISINSEDTVKSMRDYWDKYIELAGRNKFESNWHFLISPDNQVKHFAGEIGFNYAFDPKSGEFYHSTGVFVVNGDGLLSRILYGIAPSSLDLKLAIAEASDGKYRTTIEKALLYCFTYDPNKNSYVVHAVNLMRFVGGFFVLLVLAMIIFLKRGESSAKKKPSAHEKKK